MRWLERLRNLGIGLIVIGVGLGLGALVIILLTPSAIEPPSAPVFPSRTVEAGRATRPVPQTEVAAKPPTTPGAHRPISTPVSLTPSADRVNETGPHPTLLFSDRNILQYKQDIRQPESFRAKLFAALEDYLQANEASSMLASAFYYLLTEDTSRLSLAKRILFEQVSQDCWEPDGQYCGRDRMAANTLGRVTLAYDWLYPDLSQAERNRVRDRIAMEVCRLYEAAIYGENNTEERWSNWWVTDYTQNHFHSVTGGLVLGALAIDEDDPPACIATDRDGQQQVVTNQQILEYGLQKMERSHLIFDRIVDGSYPEGDSYVVAYGETYLNALWATQRLLLKDLVLESRLERFPLFYLYNSAPGAVWKPLTNHGDYYTSSRENYWFPKDLHFVSTIYQNGLAAWLAEQYYYSKSGEVEIPSRSRVVPNNFVLDFIFMDPQLKTRTPIEAKLDLSYHAADWEGVFMRSDWSDNGVAAALKVGPPGGHVAYNIARSNYQFDRWVGGGEEPVEFDLNVDHMHADANGIYLYANGAYLLPEMHGYLDNTPWGRYTSSHNTIMVSDEQGRMRGQIQGDEIGGANFGYRRWDEGSGEFWKIETPESVVGILEHASTISYDYSLGQATSAYWPELGLKRFHRHVLFAREPGYMLVVDDLEAVANKTYAWMGHSVGPVVQEGQWLKAEADNNQRLGLAVLSPSNFEFLDPMDSWKGIELEDIYAFRYVSQDRTMYEWSIRQNCRACRFVTLAFPTDEMYWEQKPAVTKLLDTNKAVAVRVEFRDSDRADVLMVSFDPGQRVSVETLTANGRAAVVEKEGATVRQALLVYGSELRESDRSLIQDLQNDSFMEVQYEEDKLLLRSPNPFGATLFAPGISEVVWERTDANNVVKTKSLRFTRRDEYITLIQ